MLNATHSVLFFYKMPQIKEQAICARKFKVNLGLNWLKIQLYFAKNEYLKSLGTKIQMSMIDFYTDLHTVLNAVTLGFI